MKQAIKITDQIYWVGVHDFNCRHFHGHMFPIAEGTSYNAYLIVDQQITVIDTVEAEFMDIMLERIRSVIGDQAVNNIIIQHGEPDHSGGFLRFMQEYPHAQPYASQAGIQSMMKQYFREYPYQRVKTGDTLSIGTRQLTFIEMPLIHWPDNMMTYVSEDEILFSNDAFGQHIASYDMYDDAHGLTRCLEQAKEYYANIVMPYGDRVEKKLNELAALNLPIAMIAPAHGIIWRSYIKECLAAYREFATYQAKAKVVIVYESIWHHTQAMAEAIAEGIGRSGVCVKVYKESQTSSAIIMKELLDAKAVLVGSGCYNNDMASNIAGFLRRLTTCHMKGKIGLGFSSYGWYRNTTATINQLLQEAGIALIDEPLILQNYTPSTSDLEQLTALGERIAAAVVNEDEPTAKIK